MLKDEKGRLDVMDFGDGCKDMMIYTSKKAAIRDSKYIPGKFKPVRVLIKEL